MRSKGIEEVLQQQRTVHVCLYLLFSLDTGAALRPSTPAICCFVPLWVKKSDSLCAAHIVPV